MDISRTKWSTRASPAKATRFGAGVYLGGDDNMIKRVPTGFDGSFEFANVPAGAATVTVSYTGYNTARESFTVAAGETAGCMRRAMCT